MLRQRAGDHTDRESAACFDWEARLESL